MTRPWTELTVASFRQRWDRLRVALTKIESGEVGKMDGQRFQLVLVYRIAR